MSKTRMCRYECGTEVGDFDEKQNKYLELSGTLHTRERCESLKNQTGTKNGNGMKASEEMVTVPKALLEIMFEFGRHIEQVRRSRK